MILEYALGVAFVLMTLAIALNLYRMVVGSRTLDRIVALDTMYINAIGLIVLMGISMNTMLYFEGALLIAMMGFVGTVALSKFFMRGEIIE